MGADNELRLCSCECIYTH